MTLRTLYQALLHSDVERLRIIAHQWGLETYAVKQTDLAAELVDAMVNEQAVTKVLDMLPKEHKGALDALLRREGKMPWSSFLRRWGPMRDIGMGKMEREELWRNPVSTAESLWLLGLVQRDFGEVFTDPIEMAYVPEELRLYMPPPNPLPVPPPQPLTSIHATMNTELNDGMAEDLVSWWVSLQRSHSTGRRVQQVDNISELMYAGIHVPVDLLTVISLEQEWLRKTKTQELRLVPDTVLTWLRSSLWEQWIRLTRAWLVSTHWRDFEHIPELQSDPVSGWFPDPVQTRQQILDILTSCDQDKWYSVDEITAYVKGYATDFMRPDGNYDRWAPREIDTGLPLRGFECWELVEGAYIRFLITGPLSWLGIVNTFDTETGDSRKIDFQLTIAGASFLGLCPPPQIKEPSKILVRPNGVIDVPVRRRYERYQLSRIAHMVDFNNVFKFRITPESLKQAQQQGIQNARIVSFLEQASGHPLPANLKAAIQKVYKTHDHAHLEKNWLLKLPEEKDFAIPALQDLIVERLTPHIALVQEQDVDRLLAILAGNGILVDYQEV